MIINETAVTAIYYKLKLLEISKHVFFGSLLKPKFLLKSQLYFWQNKIFKTLKRLKIFIKTNNNNVSYLIKNMAHQ